MTTLSALRSLGRDLNPGVANLSEFWKMADTERMAEEYRINKNLQYLRIAPPETLRKILVQYRFFTIYYISDLALLISRLPFGTLRSSLSLFLAEELGTGNPKHAHPELYDQFLRSIGVADEELERPLPENVALLENIQKLLIDESVACAIGLRGMGGECLCQIYLSAMYQHLALNPFIQSVQDRMNTKFWEIHTGDEDIHHRELTRAAINEYLIRSPEATEQLAAGYLISKWAWDSFWTGIFDSARPSLKRLGG